MTAPPDRIWACYDPGYDATYWKRQAQAFSAIDLVGQYLLRDGPTMQAAIAAARAEGREQGLREAADSLLECSVWCDSQERTDDGWRNGVTDARKHHMGCILAMTPHHQAPPPADGGEG